MIKGLIRLVFLIVAVIVVGQLEYKGRPIKEHALEIYRSPTVQALIKWGRGEATRLLGLQGSQEVGPQGGTDQLSEEDQKRLDTLLERVDK